VDLGKFKTPTIRGLAARADLVVFLAALYGARGPIR
jgi:hypothetical protein